MSVNRRQFLAGVGAGAASLALPTLTSNGAATTPKPNLLFIAVDDLNNWIHCLNGHPDVKTPNFDRLASRGVLFTGAHCAAPVCNPSRTALLTGVRPAHSGVYDNGQPWRQAPLLKDAVTLPQHFQANGYRVIGSGKIFHDQFPDPASWHEFFPSLDRQRPPDPEPAKRPANGIPNTAHFDWGPVPGGNEEMGDYQVTDWVSKQLAKEHDKPLFLACGIFRPHLPWYVPKKYFDMYPPESVTLPNIKEDDLDDVPEAGRRMAKPEGDHRKVMQYGQWRKAVQGYLASISFSDAMLGRVLDALDASPEKNNTMVVLWSDHGWHLGQKLHWRKFALWEEATHNVFMVAAPGITRPGSRCDRVVSLMDVYPTLVDLCGLSPKKGIEGASLMPLLKDPKAKWDRLAVTTYLRGNHSVRSERWRYIRYRDGSEELYDHRTDELEWTNLAGNAKYADVKKELARWLPETDAPESPHVRERGED